MVPSNKKITLNIMPFEADEFPLASPTREGNLSIQNSTSTVTSSMSGSCVMKEAKEDFWGVSGNFPRHHVRPRDEFCMPRRYPFPVPHNYIVVTRQTDEC